MRYSKSSRHVGITGCLALSCTALIAPPLHAQHAPVTLQVDIEGGKSEGRGAARGHESDSSNVVVWLTPVGGAAAPGGRSQARPAAQIVQRNKSFEPHLVVVQTGAAIDFPNRDPYLHNVFSLFDGKRFDLGFYEAGSSKAIHFDKQGVSFLFCNIHPEMSAVVVSLDTPYFALSDRSGHISIANVPDGRYQMSAWYERSLPEELKTLTKSVTISDSARALDPIRIMESPSFSLQHKNKYGQDYIPPAASSPGYGQP